MLPVLTPDEMAAADRACIEAGTPEPVLIERAGRAVARAALRMLGGSYGRRIVVATGKGNNGADGSVAARVLRARGVRVTTFALSDGVGTRALERALAEADLAIDAMFGTGFRGVLEGDAALVAAAFGSSGGPVLAVDIPSGVDGLTGAVRGDAVRADATVCFEALKPGLVLQPGSAYAGVVYLVELGISFAAPKLWVAAAADVAAWLPRRDPDTHKWKVGGVFVVGGSGGMTGAPSLVSRAALRAGAGIVVCGLPGRDAAAHASGTEVITRVLPATDEGANGDAVLAGVPLEGLDRFGAVVVGPGLGGADATVAAVRALVAAAPVPLVLDADGLNALAGQPELLRGRPAATIVTPHEGEFTRLAGAPIGDDRVGAARELAARSDAVVVLKGSRTVIAAPDGRAAVNTTGSPALATAGTGDVLAGMLGALVARGMPAFEAAVAGSWLHGRAAAVMGGPGLIASDLVDALPQVFAMLEG